MSQHHHNLQLVLSLFSRYHVALSLIVLINLQSSALSAPQVPCFFIFGDSLVDNGNNNNLNTSAKVNHPPYGDDFPQGPTGRFTNGRNVVDILAQRLGFDTYIPPFATARGDEIINGVNYASGSAGILGETGRQLGENISLERQLQNHNLTISRLPNSAKTQLNKCLYYFAIGSNDYLNNYFVPNYYSSSKIFTPQEYAAILVQRYSHYLKKLYELGARKVSVNGLGTLGCIPASLKKGTNGSLCVDSINDAVVFFNEKLKLAVNELNRNLRDAKFMFMGVENLRPAQLSSLGVKFLTKPCCQVSERTGQCAPGNTACRFRALHFFYDDFHPTEVINNIAATAAYDPIQKLINS